MGKNRRFEISDGKLIHERHSICDNFAIAKNTDPTKSNIYSSSTKRPTTCPDDVGIPIGLQQNILHLFAIIFNATLTSKNLQKNLQNIKGALYNRDFKHVFCTPNYLEIYAARWSPSRALCYQTILADIKADLADVLPGLGLEKSGHIKNEVSMTDEIRIFCFGGGAAEVVAFGGFIHQLKTEFNQQAMKNKAKKRLIPLPDSLQVDPKINISLIDSGQWQNIIHMLSDAVTKSSITVSDVKAIDMKSSSSLLRPSDIKFNFFQKDILTLSLEQMINLVGQKESLVTIFFTLNELYNSSVSRTIQFLLNLTIALKTGSILLIVDSPGSYSETSIGSSEAKYPMYWLTDHFLLMKPTNMSKDSPTKWIKLVTEKSKWFRIAEILKYPIPLENMRYQIHLYRRV